MSESWAPFQEAGLVKIQCVKPEALSEKLVPLKQV